MVFDPISRLYLIFRSGSWDNRFQAWLYIILFPTFPRSPPWLLFYPSHFAGPETALSDVPDSLIPDDLSGITSVPQSQIFVREAREFPDNEFSKKCYLLNWIFWKDKRFLSLSPIFWFENLVPDSLLTDSPRRELNHSRSLHSSLFICDLFYPPKPELTCQNCHWSDDLFDMSMSPRFVCDFCVLICYSLGFKALPFLPFFAIIGFDTFYIFLCPFSDWRELRFSFLIRIIPFSETIRLGHVIHGI